MLWRFGFHHISKVELLLDKDGGTTIEDLFNEEDLMSEVKSHNHKLMEFLSERSNMKKMVELIVQGNVIDQKKDILLASDILTSDNWALKDALISESSSPNFYKPFHNPSQKFDSTIPDSSNNQSSPSRILLSDSQSFEKYYETPELLAILWKVVNSPKGQLDSLRAGCFSKVISMLLQYKKAEMLDFIMHQDNMVQTFINHLDVLPIMELLLKLAGLDEFSSEYGVLEWLSKQRLIPQLIDCINPINDEETHSLAAQVLLDLIVISHCNVSKHDSISRNILMDELKSIPIIERLLTYMLDTNEYNFTSSFINGVYILVELIRRSCSDPDQDSDIPQQIIGEDLIDLLKVISKNIYKLVDLLSNPRSNNKPVHSTIGYQVPLGFERLRVTELLAEVLHCSKMLAFNIKFDNNEPTNLPPNNSNLTTQDFVEPTNPENDPVPVGQSIRLAFVNENVLKNIVDLFFDYPWNNFLHSVVYDILHQVLTLQTDDESNLKLIVSLFKDAQITNRIVDAPTRFQNNPNFRMGYMGHLLGIAEEIVRLFELNYDIIIPLIEPYFDQNKWDEFVENASKEAKDRDLVQPDTYNNTNDSPSNLNNESSFNEYAYSYQYKDSNENDETDHGNNDNYLPNSESEPISDIITNSLTPSTNKSIHEIEDLQNSPINYDPLSIDYNISPLAVDEKDENAAIDSKSSDTSSITKNLKYNHTFDSNILIDSDL
ncbi:Extragenic suppressor of kinetochore protein 1 [Smittium culicis]|nr:Extragenic suppressor of kinetochore protein 1 [Smittium culicis]